MSHATLFGIPVTPYGLDTCARCGEPTDYIEHHGPRDVWVGYCATHAAEQPNLAWVAYTPKRTGAPMAVCPTCGRTHFTPIKWDEHCICGTNLGRIFTHA